MPILDSIDWFPIVVSLTVLLLLPVVVLACLASQPRRGHRPTIPANPYPPPPMPRGNPIRPYPPRLDEMTAYTPASGPTSPPPWGPDGPAGRRYDGMVGREHSPASKPPTTPVLVERP